MVKISQLPNGGLLSPSGAIPVSTGGVTYQQTGTALVSVKQYGAKGDGVTNDTAAFSAALTAAASGKFSLYIPPGVYVISSTLTVPTFLSAGRSVAIPLHGDAYTSSIINYIGTGKTFAFGGADAITINNLQITTSTGGGISLNECGGLYLDHFYMDGCVSNDWAIEQTTGVVYTAHISNSRFWAENGYLGGVMTIFAGLNIKISNTFISEQQKNGDIIQINFTRNFVLDNVQLEAVGAVTTAQTFVAFNGECYNFSARNIYMEGTWDTFVNIETANIRCVNLENVFAWQYAETGGGKASPTVLNSTVNYTSTNWRIDGLVYYNQCVSAGTGYIINDPFNNIKIWGYTNISSGNQASRFVSQRYTGLDVTNTQQNAFILNDRVLDEARLGGIFNANQGSGATTSWTLYLPTSLGGSDVNKSIYGCYLLSLTVRSADKNHATTQLYYVVFDDVSPNSYTTVAPIFTDPITKGTYPTSLTVAVTNVGVLSVSADQGSGITQSFEIQAYWHRLSNL